MMNYEKDITELKKWFINEKNADEQDFNDFLEYCQWRGMLNKDAKFIDKLPFTKTNASKLLKEFSSPVKRTAKLLGLTYKKLAKELGYSEPALKSAVAKDKVSSPMLMTLNLLLENKALKDEIQDLKAKFNNLKETLNSIKQRISIKLKEFSKIKVYIIPTNEELMIARETKKCIEKGEER